MIPRGEIDRDRSYWRALATDLFSDSRFQFDGDARRAYARRRFSFARLYQYRKLTEEAEAAYREAIEFWPEEPEIILGYADLLTGLNRSVEASALLSAAVERDPYNKLLRQWFERVREDITPR
jgi:Tfp pilus assembly protein PilF